MFHEALRKPFIIPFNFRDDVLQNNHASRGSTGTQSCFSAQLTLLHKNDVLVLQEASDSSRFTLLEAEKTFLGLVRLGEKPR